VIKLTLSRSTIVTGEKIMAKRQAEGIREVMLETARVQFAVLNASIAYWSAWVESASQFVQAADKELLAIGEKATADEAVTRFTDLSRTYLRKMTELPNIAVSQFNAELGKTRAARSRRPRAARVKE
jgi:hypothetical protein